jgi:DNA primase
MFPIHSMSGRVLGFGGRILTQDKKAAKYMNSPESEIYNKSKVLYGLYQAKQTIAKEDNCYLVEGYTDVIQMYQRGVKNVGFVIRDRPNARANSPYWQAYQKHYGFV